jgi:hypothetical protein
MMYLINPRKRILKKPGTGIAKPRFYSLSTFQSLSALQKLLIKTTSLIAGSVKGFVS